MTDQRKGGIAWTEQTWNPIRGCSRVSEGCRHCYEELMAARFCGDGQPYAGIIRNGKWSGDVRVIEERLTDPLRWQRPRMVFVNSMSDLFHGALDNEQIAAIFGIMTAAPRHTFQLLTKRGKRMCDWYRWIEHEAMRFSVSERRACLHYAHKLVEHPMIAAARDIGGTWPLPNVWLGVSAEDQSTADVRVPNLLRCPATVRWVSVEPMLGPMSLEQYTDVAVAGPDGEAEDPDGRLGLDWVVVGGESGSHARPMSVEWVEDLVAELRECDVRIFVKQLGTHPLRDVFSENLGEMTEAPLLLRHEKGGDMSEWPENLRVRQWPMVCSL